MDPVEKLIPHRSPFLLVDRVLNFEPSTRQILAEKTVRQTDPYLAGHYPGRPIMPGVLILEAMIQAMTAALTLSGILKTGVALLAEADRCHFRKPVYPGDVVQLAATIDRVIAHAVRGTATATVNGQLVAEAVITLVVEA